MFQTWRGWLLITFTILLVAYAFLSYRKQPVAFMEKEIKEVWLGNIQMDFRTGLFFLKEKDPKGKDVVYLRGSVPDARQMQGHPNHCGQYNASKVLCAEWYPYSRLVVTHSKDEHAVCENFKWTASSRNYGSKYRPQTCFSMADFQWYGGSLLSKQTWPLNKATVALQPYMTRDLKNNQGQATVFGNVQDWFWINSGGVAVMMDSDVPVQVSVNQSGDKLLCFHSMQDSSPALRYTICKAGNLRKIHRYVISKMVHLPLNLPEDDFFSKPLWSSWPMINYPTQNNILKLALEVQNKQFSGYTLDVYDESVSLFKHSFFDSDRYPNLAQMFMLIHEYGFEPMVSISPNVMESDNVDKAKLLPDFRGNPFVTQRNGGKWNMVNLLVDSVFKDFVDKAKELLDPLCHLCRFRLIGGESEYFPHDVLSPSKMNIFSERFFSLANQTKKTVISTFGVNSQKYSGLILLSSPSSSWDGHGGLTGVIPAALTLGILGYPFVIPNVVGGPGMRKEVNVSYTEVIKPDKELYIRWLGVAAHMPVMMFSFPPWLYDQDVVEIAEEFVRIHKDKISPLVIKAAREYEISGTYTYTVEPL